MPTQGARAPLDHARYHRRRGSVGIGVAFALTTFGGCMPPPMNIGYVDLDPGGLGHADIQGQVGGGAEIAAAVGGGGVAAHFEPFVARKWSIPIGTGLGVSGSDHDMTFYTLLEPAVAIPVQRSSITIALLGGPWVTPTIEGTPAGGFLGAALGVHRGF